MNSRISKEKLIAQVIQRIESEFTESIVVWTGTGCPDEDFDYVDGFEAFWITDDNYERFEDFVWELEENLANPNGYSIMVHCLSPEATKKCRLKEYQEEKYLRLSQQYASVMAQLNEIHRPSCRESYELFNKTFNEDWLDIVRKGIEEMVSYFKQSLKEFNPEDFSMEYEKLMTHYEEYTDYTKSTWFSLPTFHDQEHDDILIQFLICQTDELWMTPEIDELTIDSPPASFSLAA
ncbi:hypothetical protein J7L05_05205 [bacterium]|nr:hypothetical protein [bacterium]